MKHRKMLTVGYVFKSFFFFSSCSFQGSIEQMKPGSNKLTSQLNHFRVFLHKTWTGKDNEVARSHRLVHLPDIAFQASPVRAISLLWHRWSPPNLGLQWSLDKVFLLLTSYPLHWVREKDLALISGYKHQLKLSLNKILCQATQIPRLDVNYLSH